MKENYNKRIIEEYGSRPVGYIPLLAYVTNSVVAALFMSQLLYWWGKGRNKNCVYKSAREFQEETGLIRSQQDTAIYKWQELQVLSVEVKGIPQTRHFRIDLNRLTILLDTHIIEHSNLPEIQKLFAKNSKLISRLGLNNTESNQETLSEITANITSENISKTAIYNSAADKIIEPDDIFAFDDDKKKIYKKTYTASVSES